MRLIQLDPIAGRNVASRFKALIYRRIGTWASPTMRLDLSVRLYAVRRHLAHRTHVAHLARLAHLGHLASRTICPASALIEDSLEHDSLLTSP